MDGAIAIASEVERKGRSEIDGVESAISPLNTFAKFVLKLIVESRGF